MSVFHPELVRGGAQQVCYELFKAMRSRADIDPILLAGVDPSFKSFYKSGARITGFDGRDGEFLYLSRNYDHWWHKVDAPEMLEAFAEFLLVTQPDVVHFHHFLLFGLDLLTLTRRVLPNVQVVFTFHEFMAICAADGQMVRTFDRTLCSRASSVRCHQCFPERGPEQFFMREMWVKRHLSIVDAFTTPSQFMIERYVSWGIDPSRISRVTNGQPDYSRGLAVLARRKTRNRFGFFGQMVDNKGIWVILCAVMHLRAEGFTAFAVEINGDNLRYASEAHRLEIELFQREEEARPFGERIVFFNGSYHTDQLPQRMARVDWCLVPSVWWEIFGLVISEAWMFKRPVIASNVGGPAERVRDDVDGLLFDVADASALAATIRRASTEDGLLERLIAGITPPVGPDVMIDGFLQVYTSKRRRTE